MSEQTELGRRATAAREAVWCGDVGPAQALLATAPKDREAAAWHRALRATLFRADPALGALPPVEDVRADPDPAALASIEEMERVALTTLDAAGLAASGELRASLPTPSEPATQLASELAHGWRALFRDDLGEAASALTRASDCATEQRDARAAVEAMACLALAELEAGQVGEAVARARAAARMARAEEMPQLEYLANVILARVRRAAGRPHLATRIITGLARVAPAQWRGWLAWELLLAGEPQAARALLDPEADETSTRAAAALAEALDSAERGDVDAHATAGRELTELTRGCALLARDASEILAAVDPSLRVDALEGPAAAWCAGVVSEPPRSLIGLCAQPEREHRLSASVAYIVRTPGAPARRVISLGLPLAVSEDELERLRADDRKRARTDTALAVLALAGREGLDDDHLFRATYGFAYRPATHRGTFDVLKHRVRAQLDGAGTLRRVGERNVLELERAFAVPDPRCAQPVSDRILRCVASGATTARDLARQLDISLRLAQQTLKDLVDEGACVMSKEGRKVSYLVEDSVFREPTQTRVAARDSGRS